MQMDTLLTYGLWGDFKKRRLGNERDGGYIIVESDDISYDLYISCGICDDVSFDKDFKIVYPDVKGYGFDGTVDKPDDFPEEYTYVKKNIDTNDTESTTNLYELFETSNNIFLKMDIEGGEWPWLQTLPEEYLGRIKQIVIEVHGLWYNNYGNTVNVKRDVLEKLAKTHYLVHVHGNNYGSYTNGIPEVIELTYISREFWTEAGNPPLNTVPFPLEGLDNGNADDGRADYILDKYPFVSSEY